VHLPRQLPSGASSGAGAYPLVGDPYDSNSPPAPANALPTRSTERRAALLGERVGNKPFVAHRLHRTPCRAIERRTSVWRPIRGDAIYFHCPPIVIKTGDRVSDNRNADNFPRIIGDRNAKPMTHRWLVVPMHTRNKRVGFIQGTRDDDELRSRL
jgi:hypothetical protein